MAFGGNLSTGEKNLLEENEYYLDNKGEPRKNKKYQKHEYNLKFAFKMYAKSWKIDDYKLETSTQGWQCYKKSLDVRNRITHPKKFQDLIIKNKETNNALKALSWFEKNLLHLFKSCKKSLEKMKKAKKCQ